MKLTAGVLPNLAMYFIILSRLNSKYLIVNYTVTASHVNKLVIMGGFTQKIIRELGFPPTQGTVG